MLQRRGARRSIGLLLAGIIAGIVQVDAAAAPDGALLRADAGLGGFARPGRWTPVRVEIDNTNRDLTGEIVVEWGDARVHRDVEVPAPSRTAIDLYVRTADARGAMTVRLVANGAALASIDVPVRLVVDEDPLVICAGSESLAVDAGMACTANLPPQALPRSMRGYLAADDVHIEPGAEAQLTPSQRAALQQWRAYRDLDAEGLLAQAPRAQLAAASVTGVDRPTLIAAGTAVLALLCAAVVWRRGRVIQSYLAVTSAIVLGVVAAAFAGRVGPGSEVLLRHATTVQQVGGRSVVTMRGTVVYPAAGAFEIKVHQFDGELMARGAAEQWLDAQSNPIRRGTFGRGRRDQVELDGVADYAPFEVRVEGPAVRIQNRSNATLTGCAFPDGFSETQAGDLAPGASVSARSVMPAAAAFFACSTAEPPMTFTESRFPVRTQGATVVSVKLPDPSTAPGVE